MFKKIFVSAALFVVMAGYSFAQSWPALDKPARAVGGGGQDAAVIAGAENYPFVAPVPGAKANALAWYDYLNITRGVPAGNIILLRDNEVTAESISDAAKQAAGLAGKNGTLWFVFIGHGAPDAEKNEGLLVGIDAQQTANSIKQRSLPVGDLVKSLLATKAAKVTVLVDACFSGRGVEGSPLLKGLQPLALANIGFPQDSRLVVLTAAKGDQFAGPLAGGNRPAFSYLALGALRGWAANGENNITSGAVYNYVDQTLRATVRDRQQTPVLYGDENLTLATSAGEAGPDIAALVKAQPESGNITFQVTAPGEVPVLATTKAPADLDPKAASALGNVDVDALEKYDATVTFDKSAEEPSKKAEKWLALATAAPVYKDLATQRANQWQTYADALAAADKAREHRYAIMEQDWDKLKRIFALNTVTKETKQQYAAAFLKTYGKVPMNNPYLAELLPYLPKNALTDRKFLELAIYLRDITKHAQAVQLFKKLSDRRNVVAETYYAVALIAGKDIKANTPAAFSIVNKNLPMLRKMALSGDTEAQLVLGKIYADGDGVNRDDAQSKNWIRKAAEQGYAPAQFQLGYITADPFQAVIWDRKAAEQGYAPAQANLAYMYGEGSGVGKDPVQKVNWYRKSAESGYVLAQDMLGAIFYYGNGKDGDGQDIVQAVKWLRKAIEQDNDNYPSQWLLGHIYRYGGKGVEKDAVQAVKWYLMSAERGCAVAQGELGSMYELGEGVGKNYEQAVSWYRKAAVQGNDSAQWSLGMMYENGNGVGKDYAQAINWYRKATDQGNVLAQYSLGGMYCGGKGVAVDYIECYALVSLVATQDIEVAKDFLPILESRLTPDQIERAKTRAAELAPHNKQSSKSAD